MLYIFLLSFVVFFLAYFSLLIINNYYFSDDNIRLATGETNFLHLSRHLAHYGAYFLSFKKVFFSFSPLTQIVGLWFLSLTWVFVIKIINRNYDFSLFLPICLLWLFPFFWKNMIYSYDSIFMGLSVLLWVIPFLFLNDKKLFFWVSVVCILWVATTYQTSISIYPILAIFLVIDTYFLKSDTKKALKIWILSLFSFLLGIGIFKLFIYQPYIWHIDTTVVQNDRVQNFKDSLPFLNNWIIVRRSWLFFINLTIPLLFIIAFVLKSSKNKLFTFFWVSIVLLLSTILSLIFQIIYVPGGVYRYYTSYVFLIMLLAVYAYILLENNKWFRRIVNIFFTISVVHLWFMTTAFANTLKLQWEYDKFRLYVVANDLSTIIKNKNNYQIEFWDWKLQKTTKNNRDFKDIYIDKVFSNMNIYGKDEILERYFPIKKWNPIKKGKPVIILDNMMHKIKKTGDFYYVEFK